MTHSKWLGLLSLSVILLVGVAISRFGNEGAIPSRLKAGAMWTRVQVREMPLQGGPTNWDDTEYERLAGNVLSLKHLKLEAFQDELSWMVEGADGWDALDKNGISNIFRGRIGNNQKAGIYAIRGQLDSLKQNVVITARPVVMISGNEIEFRPDSLRLLSRR